MIYDTLKDKFTQKIKSSRCIFKYWPLLETWFTPDELCGAIIHSFIFLNVYNLKLVSIYLNAATLFCCEVPEMFCGLWNFLLLSFGMRESK